MQSKSDRRDNYLVATGLVVAAGIALMAALAIVLAFQTQSLTAWIDLPALVEVTGKVLVEYLPLTAAGVIALGVILVLERVVPLHRSSVTGGRGLAEDMLWMLLAVPVTIFGTFWFSRGLNWVLKYPLAGASVDLTEYLPFGVVFAICFLLGDFLAWCIHYAKHKVPLLWRFHAVHHSALDLNLFSDSRVHVGEQFVNRLVIVLPFFVIGGDVATTVPLLVLVRLWHARLVHSNVRMNFGPLRHVLVSPQYHRMHHSLEPGDRDMNYAGTFPFLDRIFGTQVTDWDRYPDTGINDPAFPRAKSRNPIALLRAYGAQTLYPFRPAASRLPVKEPARSGQSSSSLGLTQG